MKTDPLTDAWMKHTTAAQKLQQIGFELSSLTLLGEPTSQDVKRVSQLEDEHQQAVDALAAGFFEGLRIWRARPIGDRQT
jgi:hypothetical protein